MAKKSGHKQKKKADETPHQKATDTKGSNPNSNTKNNKAHSKPKGAGPKKPNDALFEISSVPRFHEVGYPMEQQHANNGWGYPDQFSGPWDNYVGYYNPNEFIASDYLQPYTAWNNGNDAYDTVMGYMNDNVHPSWDTSMFNEQVQAVDEMIAGITASTALPTERFRLRADAPEFVPQKKLEIQSA